MAPTDLGALLDQLAMRIAEHVTSAIQSQHARADEWIPLRQCPEPRAVRRAIGRGELKGYRFSKKLWLRRAELDQWIERHPVETPRRAVPANLVDPISRALASGKLRVLERRPSRGG